MKQYRTNKMPASMLTARAAIPLVHKRGGKLRGIEMKRMVEMLGQIINEDLGLAVNVTKSIMLARTQDENGQPAVGEIGVATLIVVADDENTTESQFRSRAEGFFARLAELLGDNEFGFTFLRVEPAFFEFTEP